MDGKSIVSHFGRIGARVRVSQFNGTGGLRLDIQRDGLGQFFDIAAPSTVETRVVDLDAGLKHLLLLSTDQVLEEKRRYLCGHDEREWFVAAVPGNGVARVRQAMEALKPDLVRFEQDRRGVRGANRLRRRTGAYIRQGEWFFVPRPSLRVKPWLVLRNEPLSRGGGKPHWVEFLYREGGETVMVSGQYPNGLTLDQYRQVLSTDAGAKSWSWRTMRRNPTAFVKGTVRHPDHATIRLDGWHQVAMNTEREAPGARNVVFLD